VETQAHPFLSREWFSAVERIRAEIGDLGLPPEVRDVVINLEVRDTPEGTVEAHFAGTAIARGFASNALTTVRVPYRVARMFVSQDRTGLVQAFLSGQIVVEGDFGPLMALQGRRETPQSRTLIERVSAITG
jgi:hypothetical protein